MAIPLPFQVRSKPIATRYASAVLAALVALLLRQMLSPWLGTDSPYPHSGRQVVFSAWYCGVGPSVVTTLIGFLGCGTGSFRPLDPSCFNIGEMTFLEWLRFWRFRVSLLPLGKQPVDQTQDLSEASFGFGDSSSPTYPSHLRD